MLVVFRNESETLALKLNSLKMSLLMAEDFAHHSTKFPDKAITSLEVSKFVKSFEVKNPGITDLLFNDNSAEKRNEIIYLIKVLWGVSLMKKDAKNKSAMTISIKQETPVREIAKILNKLIVHINS